MMRPVRITAGQAIAGVDAVRLRDVLRTVGDDFGASQLARRLGSSATEAEVVLAELRVLGLVELDDDTGTCHLTLRGSSLCNATGAKPVSRKVGQRQLEQLVIRAEAINASDHYLFWVDRLVLFGSFLNPAAEKVGDVDVAVGLARREPDTDVFAEMSRKRAEESGRAFNTIVDFLGWSEHEVWLALKSRSSVLSLTSTRDRVLEICPSRVVYDRT
jgi:predicted nucleotidyltransferase